jgi:uncharacterized GH25 family protein
MKLNQEVEMKSLLTISLLFLLIALPARWGTAHDGWVEVPSIVERGQPVTISLMLGNHSNEHKSYRLAGKWNPQFTKLIIIEPSGKVNDLTNAIIDLGEDAEKTGPKGPKGFHIAPFTPQMEGVHIIVARQEEIAQHGDGPRFRGVRSARAVFTALRTPRVADAKKSSGFGRTVDSENLMEIVPVTNPLSITQDSRITFELRYKGKRFPNQNVSIIRRLAGPSAVQELTTDEKGQVTFSAGAPDTYLMRVKFEERSERREGEYDLSAYEATYVFQVFNRL